VKKEKMKAYRLGASLTCSYNTKILKLTLNSRLLKNIVNARL